MGKRLLIKERALIVTVPSIDAQIGSVCPIKKNAVRFALSDSGFVMKIQILLFYFPFLIFDFRVPPKPSLK